MNKLVSNIRMPASRRSFTAAVAVLVVGLIGLVPFAGAFFGPGQIPTALTVSGVTVRAGQWNTASARLTRLDNGRPLQGEAINFWIGDPTYPSSRIGTRLITDLNGVATVRVYGDRNWIGKNIVILAEYEQRWPYATPLPAARVTVNR